SCVVLEDSANALAISRDNSLRVVGGTVIDHDDFERFISLFKHTIDGGRHELSIVVIDDYNRCQGPAFMHCANSLFITCRANVHWPILGNSPNMPLIGLQRRRFGSGVTHFRRLGAL